MSNSNNNNISSSKNNSLLTSTSPSSASSRTFSGVGNLIRFLPTGTVFIFSFLNPIVTDNGHCSNSFSKTLAAILISFCGLSCVFASFTDSYVSAADGGAVHYGVVTPSGLWPSSSSGEDLSGLRLRLGDFVHAFFGAAVFGVLSLLDSNTVRCFYPQFESEQKILLQVLPPVIGAVAGTIFMVFPNKRHGIGQAPENGSGDSVNDDHRS